MPQVASDSVRDSAILNNKKPATSIIGAMMGSLSIGIPLAIISKRLYPDASLKGGFFIVFAMLLIWLVVLAWPVTRRVNSALSRILLEILYVHIDPDFRQEFDDEF